MRTEEDDEDDKEGPADLLADDERALVQLELICDGEKSAVSFTPKSSAK